MSSTSALRWITVLALWLSCGHALAADRGNSALTPTPLILKDGRIANVSVHVLPFHDEDATLGARADLELARLTRDAATDCFLTAQVIGHVGTDEVGAADTLRAHRLARSRADAVQASLIAGGLPAKSIASVWDWQFLVREPRATLWVFRLTEGEDCEGTPLEGARPVVADAADGKPAPRSAPARQPRSSDGAASGNEEHVIPAASRAGAADPQDGSDPNGVGGPEADSARDSVVAAVQRTGDMTSVRETAEITFATNSSYFPSDARQRLEELVASMAPGERYQIHLKAAVSSSSKVVGAKSKEEARRYNRWLAQRRLDRIQSWLSRHAGDRDFTVETSFRENDGSRTVGIAVAATS